MQEYSTAESCVKAVFPDSQITANRIDSYPVRVEVVAHLGGTKVTVWAGSQKDLFQKYASRRTKAMKDITRNLEELKEDL